MEKRVVIVAEFKDYASAPMRGLGSALGDIGKIAVGGALASGLVGIASGFANIGREASDTVAKQELLGKSLETMLSREIVKQGVQTKTVQIGSLVTQMTEKQSAANVDLARKITTTQNSIAVANEHLGEAIKKGKESAAEIEKRRINISNLNAQLSKYTAEMAKNSSSAGKTVGLYKTLTTQTVTLAEAQKLAARESKELMDWMQKQAIYSPYTMEQVSGQFKMAMAYGFTSDEAKRLTNANIDLAAALGMEGSTMERVNLALGQMRGKSKLMGQELLQMTEAGIPVREILLEMGTVAGLTAENFDKMMEAGKISSKSVYDAYTQYSEKYFKGAAKDQANTLSGLLNSLGDLKKVAEKDFFTPVFTKIQPFLSSLVDIAQNGEVRAFLKALGEGFGKLVMAPFKPAEEFLKNVQANLSLGRDLKTSLRIAFDTTFPEVSTFVKTIEAGIDEFTQRVKTEQGKGRKPLQIGVDIALDVSLDLLKTADETVKVFVDSGEAQKMGQEAGKNIGKIISEAIVGGLSIKTDGKSLPGSYGIKIGQEFGKGFREGLIESLKNIDFEHILAESLNGLLDQVKKIGDGLEADNKKRDGSFGDSIIGRLFRGLSPVPESEQKAVMPPTPSIDDWNKWQQDYLTNLPKPDSWSPEEFAALEKGGESIGKALTGGITKAAQGDKGIELGKALAQTIQGGIDGGKEYADIKSPSGLTEEEIGAPLALGIGVGVLREKGVVIEQVKSLATGVVDGLLQVFAERKGEVINSLLSMVYDAVAAIKMELGIGVATQSAAGASGNAASPQGSFGASYLPSPALAGSSARQVVVPIYLGGRVAEQWVIDTVTGAISRDETRY